MNNSRKTGLKEESLKSERQKLSFKEFFSLINKLHPHYSRLVIGILLGLVGTAANLFVPQLAQRLINNFKSLNPQLIVLALIVFIGGLIISAISG